jgi:hypothetical protein
MWVRIAARFLIWYEPRPLALYRMHSASNTGRHVHDAQDIAYTRAAISIFEAHLPPAIAKGLTRTARRTYAMTALANANRFLTAGERRSFWLHAKEAVRLDPSLRVIRRIISLLVKPRIADTRHS